MEISCDIIRDLLPLYAEDLTSKASNELVDAHLTGCDECTKQLSILKKAQVIPVDVEVKSLKRVGDTIRRRRLLAVITVLLFVVTMITSGTMLMDARVYLTAEQAVTSVERLEDGSIFISLTAENKHQNDATTARRATMPRTSHSHLPFLPLASFFIVFLLSRHPFGSVQNYPMVTI